jgi:hypothetical protein
MGPSDIIRPSEFYSFTVVGALSTMFEEMEGALSTMLEQCARDLIMLGALC